MGRVVVLLGIVLILLGAGGVIVGMIGVPLQFANTITGAVTPTAAELCKAGETLETEQGAQEYLPGGGYRRSVRYFCVSGAGARREVTGSFVTGMLGDVFRSLGTLLIPVLASCVCSVGIILTIIGALLSRRRARATSEFVFPDEP